MNLRPPGYEPDELPAALLRDIFGAGDRDRTGTGFLPRDFKSRASANSATPAWLPISLKLVQFNMIPPLCQGVFSKNFYFLLSNFGPAVIRQKGRYLNSVQPPSGHRPTIIQACGTLQQPAAHGCNSLLADREGLGHFRLHKSTGHGTWPHFRNHLAFGNRNLKPGAPPLSAPGISILPMRQGGKIQVMLHSHRSKTKIAQQYNVTIISKGPWRIKLPKKNYFPSVTMVSETSG